MNAEEVASFDENPNAEAIVRVRYYDDMGKLANFPTNPFSYYKPMVQRVVDQFADC